MVPLAGLMTAVALMLAPSIASADTASTLTVVGTSDVSDSGLVQNVIGPDMKAEFPQYTFEVHRLSRPAPRSTTRRRHPALPSALIVHAASLENSFRRRRSYSYNNQ